MIYNYEFRRYESQINVNYQLKIKIKITLARSVILYKKYI